MCMFPDGPLQLCQEEACRGVGRRVGVVVRVDIASQQGLALGRARRLGHVHRKVDEVFACNKGWVNLDSQKYGISSFTLFWQKNHEKN